MKKGNDNTLYFYSSKIKTALLAIMCLLFVMIGLTLCIFGYRDKVYELIPVGAILIILFGLLTVYPLKRTFSAKPYLVLTDKELIINSPLIKEVPIKREDIKSYDIKEQNFSTTIELILPDEEKYKAQLSGLKQQLNAMITMGGVYNTFTIGITQVKKKDRNVLYYVLDNINKPGFNLKEHDRMEQSNKTNRTKSSFKLEDKITKEYFLDTYGISLCIAGFSWIILSIEDITLIIGSFLLFPFAKVLYDAIIGFKLDEKVKKQESLIIYFYGLIYTVYLLLFLFSVAIAPFGILFMIVRAVYRFLKKIKER